MHRPIRLESRNSASLFRGLHEESGAPPCLCARRSRQTIWCRVLRSPDHAAAAAVGSGRGPPFPMVFRTRLWTCGIVVHRARPPGRTDGFTLIRGFVEFPGSLSASDPIQCSERLPCKWHEFTRAVARPLPRFPSVVRWTAFFFTCGINMLAYLIRPYRMTARILCVALMVRLLPRTSARFRHFVCCRTYYLRSREPEANPMRRRIYFVAYIFHAHGTRT